MRANLAKITAVAFETAGLLAGSSIASAQSLASHEITIRILPFRILFVNEDNKIFMIKQLADSSYGNITVKKNDVEIPMNADIQSQYLLLQNPTIASQLGINWAENHYWEKPIDPSIFDSLQKTLESTVKDNTGYSINGNRKVSVDYTDSNQLLYTVTEQ